MTDQPKLHAYAVACAFGTPNDTDPPARLMISVWIAYAPQEAAAMAMDQTHRAIAAQGQALAPHAGTTTFEITEDHLSHMLNALRTGGKGATVTPLQQVPPEIPTPPEPKPRCDPGRHTWERQGFGAPGWFCKTCGISDLSAQIMRDPGDPA